MIPVIGNKALLSSLFGAIRRGESAGCYMIEGAEGSGKHTLARTVAAAYVCEKKNEKGEPCLACPACRQVLAGRHVDVMELAPPPDKKTVSVDAVRDFLKETALTPSLGDWHVFLIFHTEQMMKGAQNALLKSIEEVRPNNVFFLMTDDASRLLPTVRSRCAKFRMEKLPDGVIREELLRRGIASDRIDAAITLADGSLGKAIEFAEDPETGARRETVLAYFDAVSKGQGFSRLCRIFSPSIRSREEADAIFSLMKLALADLAEAIECGGFEPRFFEDRRFLTDLAGVASPAGTAALFDLAEDAILANLSNANLFSTISLFNLKAAELIR